jgi:lauroyl/myristoyl acyltransferase
MNKNLLKFGITLWRLLVSCPSFMHKPISFLVGLVVLITPNKRKLYSKKNIDLCLPEFKQSQRDIIYKKNILNIGMAIISTGIAWFWSDAKIKKLVKYKIKGLDIIEKCQKEGKGILLIFKHSLHLELDARVLGMHVEMYGVERTHNSNYFDSIQSSGRLKGIKETADRNKPLKFIRWLKEGKTVLYAIDQDYGMESSEVLKFFNNKAATITAPFKIINNTQCKTFFLNSFIEKDELNISIEHFESNLSSSLSCSQSINNLIEEKIKLHPDEYLWQHRRFKSTLGKENFYK